MLDTFSIEIIFLLLLFYLPIFIYITEKTNKPKKEIIEKWTLYFSTAIYKQIQELSSCKDLCTFEKIQKQSINILKQFKKISLIYNYSWSNELSILISSLDQAINTKRDICTTNDISKILRKNKNNDIR